LKGGLWDGVTEQHFSSLEASYASLGRKNTPRMKVCRNLLLRLPLVWEQNIVIGLWPRQRWYAGSKCKTAI